MPFDNNISGAVDDAQWSHRLKREDWFYLLSLLVPFVFLTLSLKIARIIELPAEHGLAGSLTLLRSDLLFNLGYVLSWVGVFVVARSGAARLLAVVSLHVATILLALISVAADQYYGVTGTSLGMDPALFFLSSPGEFSGVVGSEVSPGMVIALLLVLARDPRPLGHSAADQTPEGAFGRACAAYILVRPRGSGPRGLRGSVFLHPSLWRTGWGEQLLCQRPIDKRAHDGV